MGTVGTHSDDPHPATLRSVSVDRTAAGVGDTVTVSWDVDDPDDVASASPRFARLDPSEGAGGSSTTTISASSSGTSSSTGAARNSSGFRVDSDTEEGTWGLVGLTVRDEAGYVTRFMDSAYARLYPGRSDGCVLVDLSAASFTVDHSKPADPTPQPTTVTFTFDGNGSGQTMNPVTTPVGGKLRLPASTLSWEGHDFLGWNTRADRLGTAYTDQAIIEPANVTLYAQWGPSGHDTITVKFDGGGGTGAPAAVTMSTSSTGAISTDVPTKDGFAFVGWNTSADGSGIQVLSGEGVGTLLNALGASDVDNEGVVTLYAQWAPAATTHTISFDENGGQGSMDTQKVADGGSTRLRLSSFERPGYTFRCWNTKADGSGTDYADGATISGVTGDLTLYAQWLPESGTTYWPSGQMMQWMPRMGYWPSVPPTTTRQTTSTANPTPQPTDNVTPGRSCVASRTASATASTLLATT